MFLDDESKNPLTMQLEEEYYDEDELDETVDWEAEFDEDQDELTGIGKKGFVGGSRNSNSTAVVTRKKNFRCTGMMIKG